MSDNELQGDGWEEWGNYVLKTMEKLENKVGKLEDKQAADKLETQKDLITLKVKATIWGSIAGIVVSGIVSIIVAVAVFSLTHKEPAKQQTQPRQPVQQENAINGAFLPREYYDKASGKRLVFGEEGVTCFS